MYIPQFFIHSSKWWTFGLFPSLCCRGYVYKSIWVPLSFLWLYTCPYLFQLLLGHISFLIYVDMYFLDKLFSLGSFNIYWKKYIGQWNPREKFCNSKKFGNSVFTLDDALMLQPYYFCKSNYYSCFINNLTSTHDLQG